MRPFTVIDQVNLQSYRLKLLKDMRVHPVFYVSLLKPFAPNMINRRRSSELPPIGSILEDSSQEWEVEEILSL